MSAPARLPVCEEAAFAPACGDADLENDHRLDGRRLFGDAQELVAVLDAFEIAGDDRGFLVLGERLEEIHLVQVGLVADADDLAHARASACAAQSRMATHSAPDWEMTEIFPGGGTDGANVAFIWWCVFSTPRQFGPCSRTPCFWQSSTNSCSASAPSALTSLNPAVMTVTTLAPASIESWIACFTNLGGTTTIPRSILPSYSLRLAVAGHAQNVFGLRIDGDDFSLITAGEEIGDERVTDLPGIARRPENGDGLWLNQLLKHNDNELKLGPFCAGRLTKLWQETVVSCHCRQ